MESKRSLRNKSLAGLPTKLFSARSVLEWALLPALLAVFFCADLTAAETAPIDSALKQRLKIAVEDTSSFDDEFIATVWLTDMALRLDKRVSDPDERMQILQNVHQEASRAELPPELVLAVIDTESAFDRFAISVAGARGLMQVMPFWLEELNRPNANLFNIQTNLRMGCTILRYYLDRENGDITKALARYNGSVGKSWYPTLVFGKLQTRWFKQ
jgi:soluble lytic murein transglycosylase-like protein